MTNPDSGLVQAYHLIENNQDFVVVNKFPGVTVQRDGDSAGLLERVAQDLSLAKLFPVHRLDKMTSGMLIMARHEEANRALSGLFARQQVHKFYLALSDRKGRKKQGLIRGDMVKSRGGSWKLASSTDNPAVTQFFSKSVVTGRRAYLLKPLTGKTHQLRVAMKALGAPILGDERYGGNVSDRGYLHAWQIGFEWKGEERIFCQLPLQGEYFLEPSFIQAVADWQAPAALAWPAYSYKHK